MFLILHNVRSAYNVGSLFRTSDAVGIAKIYLCGYTPTPSQKTALGAEITVPWEHCKQTARLLKKLKSEGIRIVALEQYQYSTDLFRYIPPANGNLALIAGNELKGVGSTLLKLVDDILEIPMYGKKESLNVAVATGIALYEIRQKLS